jgi:hypothetical protein
MASDLVAFPPSLPSIEGDILTMPENARVLSLTLHYTHFSHPQPGIKFIG